MARTEAETGNQSELLMVLLYVGIINKYVN
jgi:hypothetical protein